MNCNVCNRKIEMTFLGKIKGTIIRKQGSGKHYTICPECQEKLKTKEEILQNLK
ncbi:MAG TPA: hypothetical protein VJH97_04045 [Candidatus Nanoarchaeia archaeon]|nr:hypothetical protein [Candidatus Nanoarchaeia archaeon]